MAMEHELCANMRFIDICTELNIFQVKVLLMFVGTVIFVVFSVMIYYYRE